jgi:hypothetical protein
MARKEKKYHYIYKTTCVITGRWYVGMHSTDNLDDGYFGSGKRLRFSLNYHGKDNHRKEILEFLPNRQNLKEREKEIVNDALLKEPLCMNLVIGGEGGGFVNEEHFNKFQMAGSKAGNKAFKEKLENDLEFREAFSKKRSENNKKAIREGKIIPINDRYSWVGKKHSEESKNKMSEISKGTGTGESNSQYGTCWVTKEGTNKKINKDDLDSHLNEGWVKGRFTNIKGELVKNSKLTNDNVIEIKELLNKNELSQSKIGKMFNVKQETISKIKRGLTHKDT